MVSAANTINASPSAKGDEDTLSISAAARGKQLAVHYVARIERRLSESELTLVRNEVFRDKIAKTCAVGMNRYGFEQGMSYYLTFGTAYGQHVGNLLIDKSTCS
ncbi:hypothetical protein RFUL19S_03068 [Rhizobacter fulvus]